MSNAKDELLAVLTGVPVGREDLKKKYKDPGDRNH